MILCGRSWILKPGFTLNFVHGFDTCLLKTAFQDWVKPLITVYDGIAVSVSDMDGVQERVRQAMVETCQGDPVARLACELKVTDNQLERL